MSSFKGSHKRLLLCLSLPVLLGAVLRLWNWSAQAMLDDEWHALNFVLNRSFLDVVMQQGLGANSIPVNVYSWFTLHTTGWSEPVLKLPSLVAGISALAVLPLLINRLWGRSVACITAALMAVSPVLVFYSRILRPYAPAMLLAAASVLLAFTWMKEGRRRDLVLSALCGSLAIYYHLYTVIPVSMPYLVALTAALKPFGQRLGLHIENKKPFADLLLAGCILSAIVGVLVVIPTILNPWWAGGIHGVDHADLDTAVTLLSLLSGTRSPLLMIVVLALLLTGLALIIRQSRAIGAAMILAFLAFAAVMATTTQEGAHAGIQIARYGITFFPLSLIAIAVALSRAAELLRLRFAVLKRRYAMCAAGVLVWSPFLATSPLWTTYAAPNTFTNHSAFQYRYDPIQWLQRSPERDLSPGVSIEYSCIPPFYLQSPLLAEAKGIIEYPMLIGDQFNQYYYYQHFHRRPVVAGYVANNRFVPVEPGRDFVYGDWPIDSVMSAMPAESRRKTSWRAMVDLNDTQTLRSRYKGWLIVVHRDPRSEISGESSPDLPMSVQLATDLSVALGDPVAVDDQLAVWSIQ
jgi:hypothetical protein